MSSLQATTLTPAEALAIRQAAAAIQKHQLRLKAAGKQTDSEAREAMNLVLRTVNYADEFSSPRKVEQQPLVTA
jgi:hypothetical protein